MVAGRDYRVGGPEAPRAAAAGLVEAEWFRPPIDPERLRQLQVRGNARAAVDTAAWLGLLAGFGYLAFISLGTWWAIPAFAAYGALYGGAGDSRWHECGHGTAFKAKWLNDVVYYLASFMLLRQPTLWRWSHVRHHTDTIVVGRDAEIIFPRPSSPLSVAQVFLPVLNVPRMVVRTAKHALGRIDDEARSFVPADELGKLRWESWAYIAVLSGATAWSVAAWTIVPLLYVGLPTIYGAWLMAFFAMTQHAGLQEDVLDHRLNTRTVYMNPVLRFLYSNMNYHVEHHIFPTVPYYALPALHQEVRHHLAPAAPNTWSAYRDIATTMRRQWRDPSYDTPRDELPTPPGGGRAFVNTGHNVWAGDHHDGMFDLGPAGEPAPGGGRRVDVGDDTYALFRLDDGTLVCSQGRCTHGQAHLAEGAVMGDEVECPKHNGRFDLRSGQAVRRPATVPLALYPVEIRNGRVVSALQAQPAPSALQPQTKSVPT
ncbi:fatty acid desaturase [Candidatus Poriferisocius sp.]|uniref:fatty acid desaturase n=1 Tax=Candidatus Poriferisocius sp. TaxID=3101276 RepID=UPI003B5995AA